MFRGSDIALLSYQCVARRGIKRGGMLDAIRREFRNNSSGQSTEPGPMFNFMTRRCCLQIRSRILHSPGVRFRSGGFAGVSSQCHCSRCSRLQGYLSLSPVGGDAVTLRAPPIPPPPRYGQLHLDTCHTPLMTAAAIGVPCSGTDSPGCMPEGSGRVSWRDGARGQLACTIGCNSTRTWE
jgi:hypothetical protein